MGSCQHSAPAEVAAPSLVRQRIDDLNWREQNALAVSLNEVEKTTLAAMVASGVPLGVAREVALGCAGMASACLDACTELLNGLKTLDGATERSSWVIEGDVARNDGAHPILDAPTIVDLAQCGYDVVADCPPAIPDALAQVRSRQTGLQFNLDKRQELSGIPSPRFVVQCAGRIAAPPKPFSSEPIWVNRTAWMALKTIGTGILVPTDDTTRSDAGAGTNDND